MLLCRGLVGAWRGRRVLVWDQLSSRGQDSIRWSSAQREREAGVSEPLQKNATEILGQWSNRTSPRKGHQPLVSLQRLAQVAKDSEKLLYHHGYPNLSRGVSRDARCFPRCKNSTKSCCGKYCTLNACFQHRIGDKKILSLMTAELEKRDLNGIAASFHL